MRKLFYVTGLFLLLLNVSYSQALIKARVIDAATNQPLEGATVVTTNGDVKAMTDKNGLFLLPTNTKQDSLTVSSAGYLTKKITLPLSDEFIFVTPSFGNLNEIVVSGNREIQRRTDIPVAINVISTSIINETKATRLDMLINKVPGIYMVDLGNEQHSMAVRQPMGTKNYFLYLEDGIPIRTVGDFNHNALIEINQASLQRIEVVKGPASSLYGSEAVGGAINFITQAPSPFLSGKIQLEAGSRGYKRTDFNVSNTYKKLGIYLGGYYTDQQQPVDQHNDFRKAALTVRADYHFNPKTKLSSVADYIAYNTDQKGGLDSLHFYTKNYISFYRFSYRKVNALRIRSTFSTEWNNHNKTALTVFYRHSTIGQNPFYSISDIPATPGKAKGQINEDAFKSFGAVLQHSNTFKSINAELISGVSIDYSPASYIAEFIDINKANNIYTSYLVKDSSLTHYDVKLVNTAAYTQFEVKPADKLKLVAAIRYDRLDYKFDNHLSPGAFSGAPDNRDHFEHFTPKLGLTYDFGKSKGAYINYSVGFAPPNITDLYTGVKVPVLKASSFNNYEVGTWISIGSDKGYAELSLYKLDGRNEIVSVRLADGSYENKNAGNTRHMGIEMNIKYTPVSTVAIRLGGAYSEHKYINYVQQGKDFSGNIMAQAPAYIYNGEISYKPNYLKHVRVALELQGMSKYYADPENTATYDGFVVFNARAGYNMSRMELWVNCLNVADKIYATTVEKNTFGTTYRPGQLRTLNVGLAYSFHKK